MTGQSLLDVMELLHPELQLQSGEVDVAKGLLALNVAQDHLEALLATIPGCMGSGTGNITTADGAEASVFPPACLRLDKLQFIDSTTNRPIWDLVPLYNVAGHSNSGYYPFNILATGTTGKPQAYWTDGNLIYFSPIPDGTYTIRWFGFGSQGDITASGTFAYKDIARVPLATFAVRLITTGNNDDQTEYIEFAKEVFKPVLQAYNNFRAESGKGFQYKYAHDT